MTTVVRYARMYWRLNELAWQQVRRAAIPVLAVEGIAALVVSFVAAQTGHENLIWVPIWYAAALSMSVSIARM